MEQYPYYRELEILPSLGIKYVGSVEKSPVLTLKQAFGQNHRKTGDL